MTTVLLGTAPVALVIAHLGGRLARSSPTNRDENAIKEEEQSG